MEKLKTTELLDHYIKFTSKNTDEDVKVKSYTVKENKLNKLITNKKTLDKFEIVQKNNAGRFHLFNLRKIEEVKCSSKDSNVDNFDNLLGGFTYVLIFSLLFWFVVIYLLGHETPPMYLNESSSLPPFISLICVDFALFLYIGFSFDPKTEKQKVFHVESVEVSKKDFKLISDLKAQSLEHDFTYLFELFCEAYWDSKVNHSEEAKKTSKIIANRINEKLSIAIESENEQKEIVRDSFDNKWKMISKEL